MEYGFIILSSILFFASLSFFALAWSKKPTKRHIQEMEEAGVEIAKQIQEATEESLQLIENKMNELEKKVIFYEKEIKKATEQQKKTKEELKEVIKTEVVVKEAKENRKEILKPQFELKDEKARKISQYYREGLSVSQIAKKMDMFDGVVKVYINFIEMNEGKVS